MYTAGDKAAGSGGWPVCSPLDALPSLGTPLLVSGSMTTVQTLLQDHGIYE